MSPTQAIENVQHIPSKLAALLADLQKQAAAVESQWQGLGRVGGQRDDHAAQLLATLAPTLRLVERFAATCLTQIGDMNKNPFAE